MKEESEDGRINWFMAGLTITVFVLGCSRFLQAGTTHETVVAVFYVSAAIVSSLFIRRAS